MTKKVKELIRMMEEDGWYFVRERGDHKIYRKDGMPRVVSVPGKMNEDVPEGLCSRILRETGLNNKRS